MASPLFGPALALILQAGVLPSVNAPQLNPAAMPQVLHVYADADGISHLEVLKIAPSATPLSLKTLRAVSYAPSKVEWHNAPQPQFAINLSGTLEAEMSDGTKRKIGPGELVFLSDTTGKGHITRLLEPVTALFIAPADGFDIRSWAKGTDAKAK